MRGTGRWAVGGTRGKDGGLLRELRPLRPPCGLELLSENKGIRVGRALLRGINRLDRSRHLSNRDAGAGTIPSVVPRRGLARVWQGLM